MGARIEGGKEESLYLLQPTQGWSDAWSPMGGPADIVHSFYACVNKPSKYQSWPCYEVLETGCHAYPADPAMQGTQTQFVSPLLRHPAGTLYRICSVLEEELDYNWTDVAMMTQLHFTRSSPPWTCKAGDVQSLSREIQHRKSTIVIQVACIAARGHHPRAGKFDSPCVPSSAGEAFSLTITQSIESILYFCAY
jgi:hypothetical protein